MRLSAVTARATGQPGKAIAPVLGEPPLQGPQRYAMLAGHMRQWHVVFDGGLEKPKALERSRALCGW